MREIGLRYLHFVLALAAAFVGAAIGAAPALFAIGLPGTNFVTMSMVWSGLIPASLLGALAFWGVGRWRPLGAALGRTALAALGAACAAAALIAHAARVSWLTGDGALQMILVGAATLGFVPFCRPAGPSARSFRDGLPRRGRP